MFLIDEQHLLPVAAHADGRQHRDVRGLAVQPGLDDGAVEDQADDVLPGQAAGGPGVPVHLHLAPGPADDVLAHGALEQPEQRPLDPPRVGAGQVDRRDQRLGLLRQPPVARQRLRAPFGHLALLVLDPGARHPHRLGAEGAGELPLAVPVAVALGPLVAPAVAKATEKRGQFLFEHGLDGGADIRPQAILDRIIPGVRQ